jgi:hypothetical protein
MRQLAHGHIDERLAIMVRHRRIIEGDGCIFAIVVLAALFLLLVLLVTNLIELIIVTIFGATRELC